MLVESETKGAALEVGIDGKGLLQLKDPVEHKKVEGDVYMDLVTMGDRIVVASSNQKVTYLTIHNDRGVYYHDQITILDSGSVPQVWLFSYQNEYIIQVTSLRAVKYYVPPQKILFTNSMAKGAITQIKFEVSSKIHDQNVKTVYPIQLSSYSESNTKITIRKGFFQHYSVTFPSFDWISVEEYIYGPALEISLLTEFPDAKLDQIKTLSPNFQKAPKLYQALKQGVAFAELVTDPILGSDVIIFIQPQTERVLYSANCSYASELVCVDIPQTISVPGIVKIINHEKKSYIILVVQDDFTSEQTINIYSNNFKTRLWATVISDSSNYCKKMLFSYSWWDQRVNEMEEIPLPEF